MASQLEIAQHLDLSDRRVRGLMKEGVLPSSKGPGGYDIDACRVAYVRHLRGLASGQVRPLVEGDLGSKKQELEVEKLRHEVEKLERSARKDDKRWILHDDHCGALAVMLATLKDSLQHHCTMAAPELADVCGGDKQQAPILAEKAVDLIVGPAFNDLAGERIENAIFDVYSEDDGDESDGE